MELDIHFSHRCGSRRGMGTSCFLLLLLLPAVANARQPGPLTAPQALTSIALRTPLERPLSMGPGRPLLASAPLLAEGWKWRNLLTSFESAFSNRRRMIQLATIGMCIGLYILMRK